MIVKSQQNRNELVTRPALTQDIVDGFGPCGVEGTFRRSCEVTLNVLKAHRDVVMTLLEVLMFDPLFAWSLTPTKAYKLQYGHEPAPEKAKQWKQQVLSSNTAYFVCVFCVKKNNDLVSNGNILYRERHFSTKQKANVGSNSN